MAMRDDRWRPVSEAPDCGAVLEIRVVIEVRYPGGLATLESWYCPGGGFTRTHGRPVTRWRYWPEPPTPEDEARRELEERVVRMAAREMIGIATGRGLTPLYMGLTPEEEAVLYELAAKGGA